ncbi:MAG: hypothetical protein J5613_03385 [Alphaproteobacteria bacterium]|nr:hypothetical protein [Alphaproteobacteria bacterium]
MVRKHLKKMTKSYTNQYNHDMRKRGLLHALVVVSCGVGFGIIVALIAPETEIHEPEGKNFVQKMVNNPSARAPVNAGIVFAILAYLFAELELVGIRYESKNFVLRMARHYIPNSRNVSEDVLYDIADLIIGNMTKEERAKINNIGMLLDAKLNKISITDKVAQANAICWAKDEMSKVIDSVFVRCPVLDALVLDMLSGKVKYNKFMANTNYQEKKYQK